MRGYSPPWFHGEWEMHGSTELPDSKLSEVTYLRKRDGMYAVIVYDHVSTPDDALKELIESRLSQGAGAE